MNLHLYCLIENCVTVTATAAVIVGAYHFGAGEAAWFGLLLMLNITYVKRPSAKRTSPLQERAEPTSNAGHEASTAIRPSPT